MTNWIWIGLFTGLITLFLFVYYRQKKAINYFKIQEQELDQYAVEVE